MIRTVSSLAIVVTLTICWPATAQAQNGTRYPTEPSLSDIVNALRYITDYPVIRDATRFADSEAWRRYPTDPLGNNGQRNAFKHALWAAILSAEIGDQKARNITNGHENRAKNPPLEKQMDLFNNDIGHRRGVLNPKAPWFNLANLIQGNVNAGNLRMIRNGQFVPTNR